ncbi:Bifunctional epoxide hydrolase 2 [Strongyloides ratti]|uniref:Bifunctional epoxide hydrolase 2 n=1 Tax=Strongyloides ratti TaxID=34506 RepID=A0A090MVM0_STRRB|nr:Bifunctional epoxide hydrolase 2 [Strongyloides ratti]CEF62988.1 Bifunctional epoxide hydrolase 2 [Strongyloides ratti]
MKIKAVIFDFNGNYISNCGNEDYWNAYEEYLNLPSGSIKKTMNNSEIALYQMFTGKISAEQFEKMYFIKAFNRQHNLNIEPFPIIRDFVDVYSDDNILEEYTMKNAINNLRNSDKNYRQRRLPSNRDSYDVIVESCREGVMKPHPEIYRIMLDRLDVGAENCIFVDESNYNCETADLLGMKSILLNPMDPSACLQKLDDVLRCQKTS